MCRWITLGGCFHHRVHEIVSLLLMVLVTDSCTIHICYAKYIGHTAVTTCSTADTGHANSDEPKERD